MHLEPARAKSRKGFDCHHWTEIGASDADIDYGLELLAGMTGDPSLVHVAHEVKDFLPLDLTSRMTS